jgi:hypothetical protein
MFECCPVCMSTIMLIHSLIFEPEVNGPDLGGCVLNSSIQFGGGCLFCVLIPR